MPRGRTKIPRNYCATSARTKTTPVFTVEELRDLISKKRGKRWTARAREKLVAEYIKTKKALYKVEVELSVYRELVKEVRKAPGSPVVEDILKTIETRPELIDEQQGKLILTPENRIDFAKRAIKLHEEGLPYAKVASVLGFDRRVIRSWIAKYRRDGHCGKTLSTYSSTVL